MSDFVDENESLDKLKKSEELFSKAFHSSPTIMVIASLDDERYIEVNAAYEKATGYSHEEVLGKKVSDIFIFNQASLDEAGELLKRDGGYQRIEAEFHTKKDELRVCLQSAVTIDFSGRPCVLITAEDITDQKKAAENQNQATGQDDKQGQKPPNLTPAAEIKTPPTSSVNTDTAKTGTAQPITGAENTDSGNTTVNPLEQSEKQDEAKLHEVIEKEEYWTVKISKDIIVVAAVMIVLVFVGLWLMFH